MEARLFDPANPPAWTTPEWYAGREAAPHLEQEGHRQRLEATANLILNALAELEGGHPDGGPAVVVDLGAGDGGLLSLVPRPLGLSFGYDLQQSNVDAAKVRGVDVALWDVVAELSPDDFESRLHVAVCGEFLEHLLDPHEFLRRLRACPIQQLVVSSPYTETAEAHYDFHTWAWDEEGYETMLADSGWRVVESTRAWICQIHRCVPA